MTFNRCFLHYAFESLVSAKKTSSPTQAAPQVNKYTTVLIEYELIGKFYFRLDRLTPAFYEGMLWSRKRNGVAPYETH
jgi:hypothetical protein